MFTNCHLTFGIIRIATIFFKVYSLTCNILFQPFGTVFFNRFAKFGLGYASQTFLDFVNVLLITLDLSGHTSRSKTIRNHTVRDMGCMLDGPSLQYRAALTTLEKNEPYTDAHSCDGVSTIPLVLVNST